MAWGHGTENAAVIGTCPTGRARPCGGWPPLCLILLRANAAHKAGASSRTPKIVDAHRADGTDLSEMADVVDYRCRDERCIAASRVRCFETLADLSTYSRWWTLVTVTPEGSSTRLHPGTRFQFSGARPGGERFEWLAEVLAIDAPARIELAYAGGEYLGRTAWELEEVAGGTLVAYIYRSVRPNSQRGHDHFARWGTRLHSIAMQEDALAGLARLLEAPRTALDDEAWRQDVHRRVAAGIRGLAGPPSV
jgi:uncharacterized protein YndB with AHSA1/START domain